MSRAEERDGEREKRTKGEERSEDETVERFAKMELPALPRTNESGVQLRGDGRFE